MPNRSTDALFQLVKSLEKQEKRNFKLYVTRNSSSEDMKIIQLFDALDKMGEYDEDLLLKKNSGIRKQQLSNMKAHLYRQILSSLRLLDNERNIDIQLHELMDHARILYNKGLYLQSIKLLERLKEMARSHHQHTFLLQVLFFEKKIEALHITRSMQDRADHLTQEVDEVNRKISLISAFSNLSLLLYSWYIKHGHARNEKDETAVKRFFEQSISVSPDHVTVSGFYEELYLYQSYCWYAFIRQDFLLYYRYAQKWVMLFNREPAMIEVETTHYIKGLHNLLGAHFDLQNYPRFIEVLERFEQFASSSVVMENENNRVQVFVYLHIAKLNQHFMEGTFTDGLKLVPIIEQNLKDFALYLDRHRVLVFYYKIASLYFGSGNYGVAIDYLNRIINWKVDLRTDLQCYARLLHLIAHYEIGNLQLLEYLTKSVYRFMAKMGNLSVVEEEIFGFLRNSFRFTPKTLKPEFEKLLEKLRMLQKNKTASRAFAYLDIISWLESKIASVPIQAVIHKKFLGRNRQVGAG
ncbi:MAG: hypothetical protein ABI151_10490 [Chitinophagaceae bacterium]